MSYMNEFKGAFEGCNWCHGRGCMMCDREREAAIKAAMEPIFVPTETTRRTWRR